MPVADRCPECGEELPANVAKGLCPRCLLRQGMALVPGSKSIQHPSLTHLRHHPAPWEGHESFPDSLSQAGWHGSVQATLASSLGSFPRILLRETQAGDLTPVSRPSSSEIPGRDVEPGKYQILGEIARGGMGAILKGRDSDLGRDLAIKVLLESHRNDSTLVSRFIEEAQIGGQLQHPGIVPVYELGCFSDQRPFFTMKLVKGQTLAAMLQARSNPEQDRGRFLSVFESVCQTMAYAHARGVVHRDLKPSNVMVGSFGEVQVMDWGLAKVLRSGGVADETKPEQVHEEQVQTARSGSSQEASRAGSVLGTPAYMPPEQARGHIGAVDERADVFSLGAMLCEILTGAPPYQSGTYAEMHRLAAEGDLAPAFARLRSLGSDSELTELALHCLAPSASDRPRDAGEISRAMTAYLAGAQERLRSVEIENAQAQARAVEERKRRKTQFRMAAGIFLALLAGIAGVATQWSRAEENLKKSEARLKLANEAIERFYTGASEDVLLKEPQLKSLREKLLGSALEFYKRLQASLAGESGGNAAGELAVAYERVGEITAQIGSQEAALEAIRHARALRQRLADFQPRSESAQEALAAVLERESDSLTEIGKTAESLGILEQARAIRERLANEHPDEVRDQINLARSNHKLGNLLGFRMNRKPEALETLQRAVGLYDILDQQGPAELAILRGLGEVLGTQGTIAQEMGNTADSLNFARKAESIYKQIIDKDAGDLDSREKLGRVLMNQGYRATILNMMEDSGRVLQQGVEIFRQLAADQPNVSRFQFHLGRARQSYAWWLRKVNRKDESSKEFQEALKLFDRLALEHPTVPEYSSNQCMCLTNLGDVMQDDGRLEEASDFLRRAGEIADRLVAQNPNVDHYQTKRADIQMVVASVLARKEKKPEAEEAYERALAEHDLLVHKDEISLYNIAIAHASLSTLINGQPARLTETRRRKAAEHLDEAMTALRRAADAGYRLVDKYTSAAPLEPLRSRVDFQDLIRDLTFPAQPFAE